MPKILLALTESAIKSQLEPEVLRELNKLGDVVHWLGFDRKDTAAYGERIAAEHAEILVTSWGSPTLTLDAYRRNPQLKYLVHTAGSVRPYVEREAIEAGLLVSNWGKVISRTIAEAALMMILAGLRRVTAYQFEIHRRKGWRVEGAVPLSLFERRVGLHGLGAIGGELVKLLKPFSVRIEAYSPYTPDETFDSLGVHRQTSLKELYATNDVISIHASKTSETFHAVNAEILAATKDGAVLVNTARGAIIDTGALVEELKRGRIHAALDVFEQEPLPEDHPLRGLENCMLIPHQAGPTPDRHPDLGREALKNIRGFLAGRQVEYAITPERYDLMT